MKRLHTAAILLEQFETTKYFLINEDKWPGLLGNGDLRSCIMRKDMLDSISEGFRINRK
jgi:hypothetical protein